MQTQFSSPMKANEKALNRIDPLRKRIKRPRAISVESEGPSGSKRQRTDDEQIDLTTLPHAETTRDETAMSEVDDSPCPARRNSHTQSPIKRGGVVAFKEPLAPRVGSGTGPERKKTSAKGRQITFASDTGTSSLQAPESGSGTSALQALASGSGTSNLRAPVSGSGTSNRQARASGSRTSTLKSSSWFPPDTGSPLSKEELEKLGTIPTGAEDDYKFERTNELVPKNMGHFKKHWESGQKTEVSRTANLKRLYQDTLIIALAQHPSSKEIREFLLGPLAIPIKFSMTMLPVPPQNVKPGSSMHPPRRKGREGTAKYVAEPTPLPACPWAPLSITAQEKNNVRLIVKKAFKFVSGRLLRPLRLRLLLISV